MARAGRGEEIDEYQNRDQFGRLIRVTKSVKEDLDKPLSLHVDGVPLRVAKASLATDAQGAPLKDKDGNQKIRATTLLDAISQATARGEKLRDAVALRLGWKVGQKEHPAEWLATELGTPAKRGYERQFVDAICQRAESDAVFGDSLRKYLQDEFDPPMASPVPRTAARNPVTSEVSPQARALRRLLGDGILFPPTDDPEIRRVPVLCHQDHLNPVAMCRVCAVRIVDGKRNRLSRNLVPACQHRVDEVEAVLTMWSTTDENWNHPETPPSLQRVAPQADEQRLSVRRNVQVLTELLMSQCYRPEVDTGPEQRGQKYLNELSRLKATLDANTAAFPDAAPLAVDAQGVPTRLPRIASTTHVQWPMRADGTAGPPVTDARLRHPFEVDYDSCILCDRCIRSCRDVREFDVLGRSGKGAGAHIAFDLDGLAMYDSSCRSCGECMKACPTGAITFRELVLPLREGSKTKLPQAIAEWEQELARNQAKVVDCQELQRAVDNDRREYEPFLRIPKAFLEWNKGAIRRRHLKAGTVIAREGEFGNVAFVMEGATGTNNDATYLGAFRKLGRSQSQAQVALSRPTSLSSADLARFEREYGPLFARLDAAQKGHDEEDLAGRVIGEMSPMTHDRRTATLIALHDCRILEIDRNVLSELLRVPELRKKIEKNYARQALNNFRSEPHGQLAGTKSSAFQRSLFAEFIDTEVECLFNFLTDQNKPDISANADGSPDSVRLAKVNPKWVQCYPDQTICRLGDEAGDFYFIYQGYVKIELPNGEWELMGQQEYFGDFPLVKLALSLREEPLSTEWVGELRQQQILQRVKKRSANIIALDSVELFQFPIVPVAEFLALPEQRSLLDKMHAVMLRKQQGR